MALIRLLHSLKDLLEHHWVVELYVWGMLAKFSLARCISLYFKFAVVDFYTFSLVV